MRTEAVMNISDLMTGDLIAVGPQDGAGRALDILLESGLHALPVIGADGEAIGIVTTADLVPIDRDTIIGDFAGPPITVDSTTSVAEAAALMRSEYIHHLIVTEGVVVVGMLSSHDLLAMLVDE